MNNENEKKASGWFSLTSGFKVTAHCPDCGSHRVSYYKDRTPGLSGIAASSKGPTPACIDCGKNLPSQSTKEQKRVIHKMRINRV